VGSEEDLTELSEVLLEGFWKKRINNLGSVFDMCTVVSRRHRPSVLYQSWTSSEA